MVGSIAPPLPSEAAASRYTEGDAPFGPQTLPAAFVGSHATSTFTPTPDPHIQYSDVFVNSLVSLYNKMTGSMNTNNGSCHADCSGRGECLNGTCFCSVQYEGESCTDPNVAYFASFSCIFFIIAAISLAQLIVCIRAEYKRMKMPSLRKACIVTTQKMLYIITFVAAAIRGAYFSSPSNAELTLASSFLSSFYPLILSGGSLIVCFWAEAFHLRDVGGERPKFLGKSFLGFVIFNVITYSLFVAELVLQRKSSTEDERDFFAHVFNGCYAVLMFIVVVFFLIYGVEVYFKVRGGFVNDTLLVGTLHSRASVDGNRDVESKTREGACGSTTSDATAVACQQPLLNGSSSSAVQATLKTQMRVRGDPLERGIDYSQLSQSRFGLVFQASMLMITVCFLFSDVLGGFWKNRVPLISRNAYDIVFRVVELGVALWFPCVLWNCIAPEQLWLLNPRKILKIIDIDKSIEVATVTAANKVESSSESASVRECWICYDTDENTAAGPMIEPCLCRGDVAAVHHNCLRQWLMECAQNNNTDALACKVCQAEYELERSPNWWIGHGFTARHWLHTASLVTIMCGTIAATWTVLQLYQDAMVRSMAAGSMLLVLYICLRFLGFNTFSAYQRARYSAVKILSRHFTSTTTSVSASSMPSSPSHSVVSSTSTCSSQLSSDVSVATVSAGGQVTVDITVSAVPT